jgi:hypothetical protein
MKQGGRWQSKLFWGLVSAALLAGCGGTQDTAPPVFERPGATAGKIDAQAQLLRLPTPPPPVEFPAEAQAALEQLGLAPADAGDKGVTVALPFEMPGDRRHLFSGDTGYTANGNTTFGLGRATLDPAGSTYPDNFAFVVYRFDDVTQIPDGVLLEFGTTGTCGVAAYNFGYGSTGRWEPLFYGPGAGQLNIPLNAAGVPDWTSPQDNLAFVVFCLDPETVSVERVGLTGSGGGPFDEVENNDDPLTQQAQPIVFELQGFTGNVGFNGPNDGDEIDFFMFDADAGHTVSFSVAYGAASDFDPDGPSGLLIGITDQLYWDSGQNDGMAQVEFGSNGVAQLSYTFDGSETWPYYFVIQNIGAPHTDYAIDAGGPNPNYDEVEDNDSGATANPLTFPLTGWAGSAGLGGAYDSDFRDHYTFDAQPGGSVDLTVLYDPAADWDGTAGFAISIVDQLYVDTNGADGLTVADFGSGGVAQLTYTFDGTETAPYYLVVTNLNPGEVKPGTDYFIDGTLSDGYDETEDNEGGFADYLAEYDSSGSFSWLCSFGSAPNYPGYDGDDEDWHVFAASGFEFAVGETATLDAFYDDNTAQLELHLLDWNLNEIATSAQGDGSENITYLVDGSETQPFIVVVSGSGYGDYTLTGSR